MGLQTGDGMASMVPAGGVLVAWELYCRFVCVGRVRVPVRV